VTAVESDLDAVSQALRRGDVVIIPTDTVYGLAAAADNAAAVESMFALKRRPIDTRVAVLVADLEQAERYVLFGPTGRSLAAAFWPGPLTIVAERHVVGSLAAGDDETLGVRCPADAAVRALATAVGPIAATSANLHGRPTPRTAAGVRELFPEVDAVIDDGPRPGAASTVVSILDGSAEVLREGPITTAAIEAALDTDSGRAANH
jgi:L-threonylcarbamoyladenylate synthase